MFEIPDEIYEARTVSIIPYGELRNEVMSINVRWYCRSITLTGMYEIADFYYEEDVVHFIFPIHSGHFKVNLYSKNKDIVADSVNFFLRLRDLLHLNDNKEFNDLERLQFIVKNVNAKYEALFL